MFSDPPFTPNQHNTPATPAAPFKPVKYGAVFDDNGHPMPGIDYASRTGGVAGPMTNNNPTPRFTIHIKGSSGSDDDLPVNPSATHALLQERYRQQHDPRAEKERKWVRAEQDRIEKELDGVKVEEVVKEEKEKENQGGGGKGNRVEWTAKRLDGGARIVNSQQPWLAGHGKRGDAWETCTTMFNARFKLAVTAQVFRAKMEAIVGWKKDPTNPKYKALGVVLGSGSGDAITLGAQMEAMETQYDQGKGKSDEAKAKIKEKNDQDKAGGEAIRKASMQGLRRKRAISISSDEDNADTDKNPKASASTIDIDDSDCDADDEDDEKPKPKSKKLKSKRRRLMDRTSSTSDDLLALFKAENERRAAHDERIAKSWEAFVGNSRKQGEMLKELLLGKEKDDA
uniref:Uncharacterized protein n=1 Tax=Mycena chlorophos TaxID=658473 RepID=A0ABQ0KU35_MYCCL|nr:predicted protein [Mycena chlorophos]